MKYHAKVQEIIDKVKSGEIEPKRYKIQIDDEYFTHINFYPNKQLWYIHNFKNGRLHGKCVGLHPNGVVHYIRNYKNDKLHGKMECWFENGNRKFIENWKNDEQHGKCKGWFSNGAVRYVRVYDNGELIEDVTKQRGK